MNNVTAEVTAHHMSNTLSLVQDAIVTTWIALGALAVLEIAVLVVMLRIFAAWWRYAR